MPATFEFFRFRFHFRALTPLRFPPGEAGNVIRGGLGLALRHCAPPAVYTAFFRPSAAPGAAPSGLADPPRPFLVRASHLAGLQPAGCPFYWDVHAFDLANPPLAILRQSFQHMAASGFGPGRGRASLELIEQLDLLDRPQPLWPDSLHPTAPLAIDLAPEAGAPPAAGVHLQFLTPTELKGDGGLVDRPGFAILFSRLRDRIGALSALYGRGPLPVDFRGIGERARAVRLVRCSLETRHAVRRSSRTGLVHPLGGFTGHAEYAGDLAEFLPWLAAARWAGVGRHTVWGHGEVRIVAVSTAEPA